MFYRVYFYQVNNFALEHFSVSQLYRIRHEMWEKNLCLLFSEDKQEIAMIAASNLLTLSQVQKTILNS